MGKILYSQNMGGNHHGCRKNPYIAEAAQSLYESHADEVTEMQCRARRDYYKQKNTTEKIMRELTTENATLIKEKETLSNELVALSNENATLSGEIAQLHARIKELEVSHT